jgi:hypothetical protein
MCDCGLRSVSRKWKKRPVIALHPNMGSSAKRAFWLGRRPEQAHSPSAFTAWPKAGFWRW